VPAEAVVPGLLHCLLEWLGAVPLALWPAHGLRLEAVLGTLELALANAARPKVCDGSVRRAFPSWCT
jgi:hypothetical protein